MMTIVASARRALYAPSVAERAAKFLIYVRFGCDSAEADIITDYLEVDPADWRGCVCAIVRLF